MNLNELKAIAVEAALEAGDLIRSYARKKVTIEHKEGGISYASQVVTEVDKKAEAIILKHLNPTLEKHNLALLSEETEDDNSRFEKPHFWCVDPLDGTLSFIEGRAGYSVAIALISKEGESVLGVVFDPVKSNLYVAQKSKGVSKNGKPWHPKIKNNFLTYVTDKKLEKDARSEDIKRILEKKSTNLPPYQILDGAGSIMNAIRVLENGPAVMLKFPKPEKGGGSLWDFGATEIFFKELGLRATNFHGDKLDLNRKDSSFLNHEGVWYEM